MPTGTDISTSDKKQQQNPLDTAISRAMNTNYKGSMEERDLSLYIMSFVDQSEKFHPYVQASFTCCNGPGQTIAAAIGIGYRMCQEDLKNQS